MSKPNVYLDHLIPRENLRYKRTRLLEVQDTDDWQGLPPAKYCRS